MDELSVSLLTKVLVETSQKCAPGVKLDEEDDFHNEKDVKQHQSCRRGRPPRLKQDERLGTS